MGLDFEQIRAFHWKPKAQVELSARLLSEALDEAIGIRKRILELAGEGTYAAQREKELLLADAEDALKRVRLIADLVVGAFFGQKSDKERERERTRRLDGVTEWLAAEERGDVATALAAQAELEGLQTELRAEQVPFHWMIEFPEVFYAQRPDPLDGNKTTGRAWVDAFVGNPPFAGKNGISAAGGEHYIDWFMALMPELQGRPNTDLCAYFFRRGMDLLGANGTLGLVATNTIAEGDSRLMSLKALLDAGGEIYRADANLPWPGDAAVTVSVVHIGFGSTLPSVGSRYLGTRPVSAIDSRLLPQRERSDPQRLHSNKQISFMGGKLVGAGLAVTLEQHRDLVAADPRNAQVLRPYLGGEEVNRNPGGKFDRYMIDFTSKSLEEARAWPMLLRIAEEKVRPAREQDKRGTYRTYWWRPGESGGALYSALNGLRRCLVTANVTKHLMFSFQPTSTFFSQTLYVFALDSLSAFALLQSRIHEPWARLLSSSLEDRLRYAASDCFETFPFPQTDPRTVIPELEAIGEKLYATRARFMVETNQGLTKTYNALKDPGCDDPRILELRALHEDMDRAVLAAYGWTDIAVPPYCPASDADRAALQAFEDEVIDRLFVLNAERAAAEQQAAAAAAPPPKATRSRAQKPATDAAPKKPRKGRNGSDDGQGKLGF